MDVVTVVFIAFGLAMDAFAVSVTSGFAIKKLKVHHALRIAIFFGAFQAIMPAIGWFAGLSLRNLISELDHWIALVLLAAIGGKMIYESFKLESDKKQINPLRPDVLLMLSIATSIDALVVGVTFAFLNIAIVWPVLIIGLITFVTSFIGVFIGDKFGHIFESKIELVGGLILIAVGLKILLEHLL
jgi:putative Mn2+ efflux pump MntP